jgi:hypothetical protein
VTWLSWRQQRVETWVAAAGLALMAVFLIPDGLHIATAYAHQVACADHRSRACSNAIGTFDDVAFRLGDAPVSFIFLPGLIGVALAVPVLLELENGTAAFAWTQGVTRARWLRSKLALAVVTAVVTGACSALLVGWFRGPIDTVYGRLGHRAFDLEGTVPIAYFLFALGLALVFGVLLRRTIPALLIAGVTFGVTRFYADAWLRQRLLTPVTLNWPPSQHGPGIRDWVISGGYANRAGVVSHASERMVARCLDKDMHSMYLLRHPTLTNRLEHQCLVKLGATYNHAVYFKAGRFWDFQAIETGMYLGAALALIAFATWWVLRADQRA